MTLVDRLRARFETDLLDDELQAVLDSERAAIVARYGPDAESGPMTLDFNTGGSVLLFHRPADETEAVAIEEFGQATSTTLADDDWRIEVGGRLLRRLSTGTNPRWQWGPLTRVTYTPVSDTAERDEITLKLAILTLTWQGLVKSETVGDAITSGAVTPDAWQRERELLLRSLGAYAGVGLV